MFPFHLPKEAGQTRRFDASGLSPDVWMPYAVPAGAVALFILAVGAGGGGGNGFTRAAGSAGGGGGGGGSGGLSRLLIRTALIPQTLYVQVGTGGAPNTVGGRSAVSVDGGPYHVAKNLVLANGGGAGGNGSGTAAGASGGAAGGGTSGAYGAIGEFIPLGGSAGGAGGAQTGADGASTTFGAANSPLCGGTGGAGCTSGDFSGGNINATGLVPLIVGGTTSNGRNGLAGFELWLPPTFTGGTGGASNNSGVAGNGGAGGRGCGGGGGGAGTTGGSGGRGGDGFVWITAIF